MSIINPHEAQGRASQDSEVENSSRSTLEDTGLVKEEWSIPFEDLVLESPIGEGSFGKVIKGDYFGTKVAVKKLFNHDDKKMQKYIQRELATLKSIRHPNIVQFMGLCLHSSGLYLVTEFIPGGDLTVYIDDLKLAFTWKMIIKVALLVAQAMAYLHAKNIVHRDMKCSNLLVGENWNIKVCDFGMARKTTKQMAQMTICGTDEYMAPEVILGSDYNQKADVFSYGLCLYEIVTRQVPPQREFKKKFAFDVDEFTRSLPTNCPQGVFDLILDCCKYEPETRPTFKEIIETLNSLNQVLTDEPAKYKWKLPEERKPTNRPKTNNQLDELAKEIEDTLTLPSTSSPSQPAPNATNNANSNSSQPAQRWDASRRHTTAAPKANDKIGETRRNTIGSQRDLQFDAAIHDIISNGNLEGLKELLSAVPSANLDIPDKNGETPLFLAVKYSRADIVEELLKKKLSSVNTPNNSGSYPIHVACKNSNVKITRLLLDNLAKPKVVDRAKNYPIHTACELGNVELVDLLVEKGGKTLLEVSNEGGETPLLLCCRMGYDPIALALIKKGANVLISDKQKRSPIWYAAKSGKIALCKALIDAKCDLQGEADDGTSPFLQAAKENHLEVAVLLVKSGADVSKYRGHSLGNTPEFRNAVLEAAQLVNPNLKSSTKSSLASSVNMPTK